MTCIGKVSKGVVILPPGLDLADGTELEVRLPDSTDRGIPFSERYKSFIGMADDLPADLANNLDHYLHGHPKQNLTAALTGDHHFEQAGFVALLK